MSGLYRSEDMSYVRLLMTRDVAYSTVRALGEFGMFYPVDLSGGEGISSEDSLQYKKRVATCAYWEKKLLTFKEAFDQFDVKIPTDGPNPTHIQSADVIADLKAWLEPLEISVANHVMFKRQQTEKINECEERLEVLKYVQSQRPAFEREDSAEGEYGSFAEEEQKSLLRSEREEDEELGTSTGSLGPLTQTIAGVVPLDKVPLLERMLFRVSRGNALTKFAPIPKQIEDAVTGMKVKKAVFSIIYMGEQLKRRIVRVAEHIGATVYDIPSRHRDINMMIRELIPRLTDYQAVVARTSQEIKSLLTTIAGSGGEKNTSPWIEWLHRIRCEMSISETLRKCGSEGSSSNMLILEGWIPDEELENLNHSLFEAVKDTRLQQAVLQRIPNYASPPTYFKVNEFTGSFQGIVDTYGTPRYKEVNPGLFTIISFPFLFGVMYGDVGHGSFLFLFSLYLVLRESSLRKQLERGEMGEIPRMIFGGRYLLILMGAFAVYCGFIYNDCLSIPLNLFGSSWAFDSKGENAEFSGHPYPVGMDPAWGHTSNELAFFNSFKMKLSVTLGVAQMVFGLFLLLANELYWKNMDAVFLEFIPRLVFMLATFGYMIFLILYKFTVDWRHSSRNPPNLVQTMISMFLQPGHVDADKLLYSGQEVVQSILLLLALGSVPVMLFGVPCLARSKHRRRFGLKGSGYENEHSMNYDEDAFELKEDEDRYHNSKSYSQEPTAPLLTQADELAKKADVGKHAGAHQSGGGGHEFSGEDAEYNFADHLITNSIHTIEFVLGAVSNTASYLRLWALSLAHAQLSQVFWSRMVMQYGISTGNPVMIAIGVAVWAAATFSVLLCMDVLECFLHALRLHWVEFQNKFYHADGYAFDPFRFQTNAKADAFSHVGQ